MKIAEGDTTFNVQLHGYTGYCKLRSVSNGGMCAIMKDGKRLLVWEGLNTEDWMDSERIWIMDELNKVAACGVYMRPNGPRNGVNYQKNKELFDQLSLEMLDRRRNGYECIIMGDFNAHVSVGDRFYFNSYPHVENMNGELLNEFAESLDLYCLNGLQWNGKTESKYTYQRDLGVHYNASIVDYMMTDMGTMNRVRNAEVSDSEIESVSSDHSALMLTLCGVPRRTTVQPVAKRNMKVRNWEKYTDVMRKRNTGNVMERLRRMNIQERHDEIVRMMRTTVTSMCANSTLNGARNTRVKVGSDGRNYRSYRQWMRTEMNKGVSMDQMREKRSEINKKYKIYRLGVLTKELQRKAKIRRMLKAKGTEAAKLFWKYVPTTKTRVESKLQCLMKGDTKVFGLQERIEVIEEHFQNKFYTQDVSRIVQTLDEYVEEENMDLEMLNGRGLTDEQKAIMSRPIERNEVEVVLKSLKEDRASGLDNVTPGMLKHADESTVILLTELFNEILESGSIPADWKAGNVKLILKRPPEEQIGNYRPITLISCVSKVMTKLLAKRISEAVRVADVLCDEQNGFRKGRSTVDNQFILNSLLEINKSKGLQSCLLFVDLKEAYDRVDRKLLLLKLRKIGFPDKVIEFIHRYYENDFIISQLEGAVTKKQFQSRGLRQGCNLSSILFIIYIMDLSIMLKMTGLGCQISVIILCILLFADDIILMANDMDTLGKLKEVLVRWCELNRMQVSLSKTQVVTEDDSVELFLDENNQEVIESVKSYKYLGILQYRTVMLTSRNRHREILGKAEKYKRMLLNKLRTVPDSIEVYRALWEAVADVMQCQRRRM